MNNYKEEDLKKTKGQRGVYEIAIRVMISIVILWMIWYVLFEMPYKYTQRDRRLKEELKEMKEEIVDVTALKQDIALKEFEMQSK